MASVSRLGLPERQRKYKIALTPLADAMFQLLIFFMLSSNLTPYSLLGVQSAAPVASEEGAEDGAGSESEAVEAQETLPPDVNLWTLEAETIVVGGQRFDFDALEGLASALGASGRPAQVVLIIQPSATVQDITTVLGRLQTADLSSVQVTTGEN